MQTGKIIDYRGGSGNNNGRFRDALPWDHLIELNLGLLTEVLFAEIAKDLFNVRPERFILLISSTASADVTALAAVYLSISMNDRGL